MQVKMTNRDRTEKQAASVLIIDDDPTILHSVGRVLERLGYVVYRAASGEEGVRTWRRHRPTVTLCDLYLPGIDGFAVLEQLSSEKAMVIVFSGQGQTKEAVRAMRQGAENFLTKPIELEHLAEAVERAAEKAQMGRELRRLGKRAKSSLFSWGARVARVALAASAVCMGIWIGKYMEPPLEPAPALYEIPAEYIKQPGEFTRARAWSNALSMLPSNSRLGAEHRK